MVGNIKYEKYGKYIAWLGIGVLYLLCFKIVLDSGYMFDDMWTHTDIGLAINNDTTLSALVLGDIKRWAGSNGRILIFSFYCDFVLNYLTLFQYKLMIVIAMFLDGMLLGGIIKELTGSKKLAYLSVIMFPSIVSLRATYYTGVYGFHALVQFCLLFVTLAVYMYILYRKKKKIIYQVISCISWFIALGMYETSYVLCICFIVALICIDGWDYVKKHFWKSIKTGLPQIIIMVMWSIANVVARLLASGEYDGATPNFSLTKIGMTFLKQCTGALGFGAAWIDCLQCDKEFWFAFVRDNVGRIKLFTYVMFFVAFLYVVLFLKDKIENRLTGMVWMGAVLIVMPSLLISISVKYQREVDWFSGYIPAYFGSWGIAILAAVLIITLGRKINNKKLFVVFNVAAAMFFTCMFAFDNIVGEYSVQDVNVFYQNDVDTMEDSIQAGILDDIDMKYVLDTSYSTYTLDPGYAHRAYSTWLKRKNRIYGWDDVYADKGENAELNDFYDEMQADGFKIINHLANWYVVLADCNDLKLYLEDDGYDYDAYSRNIDIFIYSDRPQQFICKDKDGNKLQVELSDSDKIKTSKTGSVYRVRFDRDINVNTIIIGG